MAAIRSLLLRRGSFSLLRTRSLHSAASISPLKALTFSSTTPWEWNSVRHRTKSSTNAYDETYEDSSVNKKGVLEDYKFAYEDFKPRELDITEIEGCDMNHWLITVEFPKDPRPSPEDMVRFYEETVAKSLNLSLEQAKKKIYACSTSNYTGFHVEVTEQESEKFRGKSGVVFILPDSYVDKEKKEYGGDKYINGIIIPRPRPNMIGKTRVDPRTDRPDEPVPAHRPNQQSQTSSHSSHLRIPPPNSQQEPGPTHRAPPSYSPPAQQNYGPGATHRAPLPPNYQPPGPQSHGPPTQGPSMNYRPNHYPGPSHGAPPNYYPGPAQAPGYPPANYGPGPPTAVHFARSPYFAPYYQESYYRPPCYHWQGGYSNTAPNGYGPGVYPYYYYYYPYQNYGPSQQGYYGDYYQNYGPQQHGSPYGQEQQDGGGYHHQGQGPPPGGYWR